MEVRSRLLLRIRPPLCWSPISAVPGESVYRVTYLDDLSRALKHEAVSVEVLSGERAGWTGWVDSRPFGLWRGVPAGFVLIFVGVVRAESNRRDEGTQSSFVIKDDDGDDTGLTDLNLH